MPNFYAYFTEIIYYLQWLEYETLKILKRDVWIILPAAGAVLLLIVICLLVMARARKIKRESERGQTRRTADAPKTADGRKIATLFSGRLLLPDTLPGAKHPQAPLSAKRSPAGAMPAGTPRQVKAAPALVPLLTELLNRYYVAARASIHKTGGAFFTNHDGSVQADWGMNASTGDAAHDALNAVRAALLLRIRLVEMNRERRTAGEMPVAMAAGLSTGPFFLDMPGAARNAPPHIIGANTPLAVKAREACARSGADIIITAKTWHLINKYIISEELDPVYADNGTTLRLFAVINIRAPLGARQPRPVNMRELQSLLRHGTLRAIAG